MVGKSQAAWEAADGKASEEAARKEAARIEAERLAAEEAEKNRPRTLQEELDEWLSPVGKPLDQYPTLMAYVAELEADLGLSNGHFLQKEEVAYCATARGDVVYIGTSEPKRPEAWTGAGLLRTGADTWEAAP